MGKRTAGAEGQWPAQAGGFTEEKVCQGFSGEGTEGVEAWSKLMGKLFQAPRLAWEDVSKRLQLQVCVTPHHCLAIQLHFH